MFFFNVFLSSQIISLYFTYLILKFSHVIFLTDMKFFRKSQKVIYSGEFTQSSIEDTSSVLSDCWRSILHFSFIKQDKTP